LLLLLLCWTATIFGGVSSVVSVKVDSVSDTTEGSVFDGEPDGVGDNSNLAW
jgi:hypothetical protein